MIQVCRQPTYHQHHRGEPFIRRPEDSRSRLARKALFAFDKLFEAAVALALLLTTIGMIKLFFVKEKLQVSGIVLNETVCE